MPLNQRHPVDLPPPRFAPLLPWAVGLMVGIVVDSVACPPPAWGWVCMAGASVLMLILRPHLRWCIVLSLVGAAGLGAVLHHRAFDEIPEDHVVRFTRAEPVLARIEGRIVSRPKTYHRGYAPFEPWLYDRERTAFVLEVERIDTREGEAAVSGLVRVTVKEPDLAVRREGRVRAFGWLYRPPAPRNPAAFNWRRFHARRGVQVGLSCDRCEAVQILPGDESSASSLLRRFRERVRRVLLDERLDSGDESVTLLDAMVLGRRGGMDRDIERAFITTGCAHYLAVSGIHVGMLALAIWWPFRLFGFSRRSTALVVAVVVVGYALLADPRPPILRAAVMTCALCLSLLARRRPATINALCLAAIVLLVADPPSLFDVGFQLSFVTVTGIVIFVPLMTGWLRSISRRRRGLVVPVLTSADESEVIDPDVHFAPRGRDVAARRLMELCCVGVVAWICSAPLIAASFGRLSPWGWLDSLVAFPLVFAVVVLGFAKIAVGFAIPVLSLPVDWLLGVASGCLLSLMHWLARIPGTSMGVASPPWWACLAYYAALLAWASYARRLLARRVALVVVGVGVFVLAGWWAQRSSPEGLRVTQLAVGRATTTLIELPSGGAWLYDVGGSGSFDPGRGLVLPLLSARGIHRLEGIILSHPNLDHFGGLPSVLEAVPCGRVYASPSFESRSGPNTPSRALLKYLARRSVGLTPLDAGSTLTLGPRVKAEVLWPVPGVPLPPDTNETSLVLRVRHAGRSILLTGDIGDTAQQWLLENARDRLAADVLVLPHHGAVVGNTAAFVKAVGARFLIRSTSVRDADSPRLMRIVEGRHLYNTAERGAIEITMGEPGIEVKGFVDAASP